MSSSAAVSLTDSIINSSNNPAISGSGAGTLFIAVVSFVSNAVIANTLTTVYFPTSLGKSTITGNLAFAVAGNKILSTSVGSSTTAGANSFGAFALSGAATTTVAT